MFSCPLAVSFACLLQVAPQVGSSIVGTVVDDRELPVANATVAVTPENLTVRTDSLGHFRVGPLPSGPQNIVAHAIGVPGAAADEI